MKFQIYKSWFMYRWRLVAANGEIIASGEGYTRKTNVIEVINLIKSTNDGVPTEDLT